MTVFHNPDDYRAFVALMAEASIRIPMRILAYCLMPNHFHLVLRPAGGDDLSRWMHWLMTTHVSRYRRLHRASGHVWQGRFKAFPIEPDEHLLTAIRHVERNPLRAHLVERAESWPWSSLCPRDRPEPISIADSPGPIGRGERWIEQVNSAPLAADDDRIRECIRRDRPFGGELWTWATARELGLESSLRPRGRPRKIRIS